MEWKKEAGQTAKALTKDEARVLQRAMASSGWSEAEIHKALVDAGISEEEIRSWEEEEDFGGLQH